MGTLKILAAVLFAGVLAGSEQAEPLRPLALNGTAPAMAVHALMAIAQGDDAALAEIPASLFHASVAIPDDRNADLARRWTAMIPRALDRTSETGRTRIMEVLDRMCRAELDLAPVERQTGICEDFLPVPSAVSALAREAAAAFDHSDYRGCMARSYELPFDSCRDRRDTIALRLSCLGPTVDPCDRLVEVGSPQLQDGPVALNSNDLGISVTWKIVPGWVLALSADERVLWQYRTNLAAHVVTGSGGCVVQDADGLRAISERGNVYPLSPPPGSTKCQAIVGGFAWFSVANHIWRLPIGSGSPIHFDLTGDPVCPPLVRGTRSLWLTATELNLFDLDVRLHRLHVALPVGSGWTLAAEGHQVALISPKQSRYVCRFFDEDFVKSDVLGRARMLIDAYRYHDALACLATEPTTAEARSLIFRAHLGLGPEHIAENADEICSYASSAPDTALVRFVQFKATDPDRSERLAEPLICWLKDHPTLVVGWSASDVTTTPENQPHCSTAGILANAIEHWRGQRRTGVPAMSDPLEEVPSSTTCPVEIDSTVRDPRLGDVHRFGDRLVCLTYGRGWTCLTSYTPEGLLRWQTRWDSDPTVPTRSLNVTPATVTISEGGGHLMVIDSADGTIKASVTIPSGDAQPSRTCSVAQSRPSGSYMVVCLDPLGDAVSIAVSPSNEAFDPVVHAIIAERRRLPARARWMVPLPRSGEVLVQMENTQTVLFPQQRTVHLPSAVTVGTQPTVTPEGLIVDGALYRWNR